MSVSEEIKKKATCDAEKALKGWLRLFYENSETGPIHKNINIKKTFYHKLEDFLKVFACPYHIKDYLLRMERRKDKPIRHCKALQRHATLAKRRRNNESSVVSHHLDSHDSNRSTPCTLVGCRMWVAGGHHTLHNASISDQWDSQGIG